jgi:hypothetical protein
MKTIFLISFIFCICFTSFSQTIITKTNTLDSSKTLQIVETSCGQCQFKMAGKGCNLAVRIKGKPYFVDGTSIDEHGDAHAQDGFCKAVRKAQVQGKVVKKRFVVTYFKLL